MLNLTGLHLGLLTDWVAGEEVDVGAPAELFAEVPDHCEDA